MKKIKWHCKNMVKMFTFRTSEWNIWEFLKLNFHLGNITMKYFDTCKIFPPTISPAKLFARFSLPLQTVLVLIELCFSENILFVNPSHPHHSLAKQKQSPQKSSYYILSGNRIYNVPIEICLIHSFSWVVKSSPFLLQAAAWYNPFRN